MVWEEHKIKVERVYKENEMARKVMTKAKRKIAVGKKKKSTASKKIVAKKIAGKSKTIKRKKVVKSKKKISFIPKGYNTITPYLFVKHGAKAIEFYVKNFGAKEVMRMESPDGKIGHAELKMGDSKIMLADECPEKRSSSAAHGGSGACIHFYTKNVDETVKKAISSGAKLVHAVEDMFYGDRSGILEDPFGYVWCVSTHIENVTPAKMKKRAAELFRKK